MKQYGFVYVTTSHKEEAKKIAHICLSQKLAACVNIFPPILSCYEWQGEQKEEEETVLILKTRQDLFKTLCETIKNKHSYTCPCIVFIPILKGLPSFFSWMDSQLKPIMSKEKI